MLYRIDELKDMALINAIADYMREWMYQEINEEYGKGRSGTTIDDILYSSNVNGCLYDGDGNLQEVSMEDSRGLTELTEDELRQVELGYAIENMQHPDTDLIPLSEIEDYYSDTEFVQDDFCDNLEGAERNRRLCRDVYDYI